MDHPRRVRLPAEVRPWTKGSARFDPERMWAGTPACSPALTTPCSRRPPPVDPRGLVARSWLRVQAQGVDPDRREPPGPIDASQVEQRRARSPLHQVLPELRASLTAVAEDAAHVMVVTAADGLLLWREGSTRVGTGSPTPSASSGAPTGPRHPSARTPSAPRWPSTRRCSCSPPSTSCAPSTPWTCTASPIHDPRTGEMLGVVDVSGPAETVHPMTVALVHTAVRLAETACGAPRAAARRAAHRRRADARVRSGPGLVVDDHGWVAAARGLPQVDRVAAPTADGPVAVHGLGLCIPEPVPGGWLLRPRAQRPVAAAHPGARRAPAPRRRRRAPTCGCIPCRPGTPRCSCCWPARGRRGWTPPRSARRSTATWAAW